MQEKKHKVTPAGEGAVVSTSSRVSFVITVWLEPQEAEASPEWRWRVVHTQSGDEANFTRLAEVLAFITTQSGTPAPQ